MNEAEQERARIRALVVVRMNLFREYEQERRDGRDEDGAHAWGLAWRGMKGLIEEIDNGARPPNFPKQPH